MTAPLASLPGRPASRTRIRARSGQPESALGSLGDRGAALRERLRPGDVVLVKASKSAGLWEVADGLLAEDDQ
ncbi:MAG: hypothetical protein ACRDOI_24820 [Trebonia sp.]